MSAGKTSYGTMLSLGLGLVLRLIQGGREEDKVRAGSRPCQLKWPAAGQLWV